MKKLIVAFWLGVAAGAFVADSALAAYWMPDGLWCLTHGAGTDSCVGCIDDCN